MEMHYLIHAIKIPNNLQIKSLSRQSALIEICTLSSIDMAVVLDFMITILKECFNKQKMSAIVYFNHHICQMTYESYHFRQSTVY